MNAVITADIVNSTLISPGSFPGLIKQLKQVFKKDKIEFYRGDSFQALVEDADDALLKCIKCRLLAIQYTEKSKVDIRLSISIGSLSSGITNLGLNMEEVFVNSGRYFDKFQSSSRRLYITSGNEEKDFTYEIIAEYTDTLLEKITARQAEVLFSLLSGKSQVETAKELNKTTATISQHVKAARYQEIESMLNKFKTLTERLQYGE